MSNSEVSGSGSELSSAGEEMSNWDGTDFLAPVCTSYVPSRGAYQDRTLGLRSSGSGRGTGFEKSKGDPVGLSTLRGGLESDGSE